MFSRRSFLKVGGLSIPVAGFVHEIFTRSALAQDAKLQNSV